MRVLEGRLGAAVSLSFLRSNSTRKTREEAMKNRLGLAACVATVFTVAGLAAPLLGGPADDTPAKDGVEAKVSLQEAEDLGWIMEKQDLG